MVSSADSSDGGKAEVRNGWNVQHAGTIQSDKQHFRTRKSPGQYIPGTPFSIPVAWLPNREEPTYCLMGWSSGFRFVLIAALPTSPSEAVDVAAFVPGYSGGSATDSHRFPCTPLPDVLTHGSSHGRQYIWNYHPLHSQSREKPDQEKPQHKEEGRLSPIPGEGFPREPTICELELFRRLANPAGHCLGKAFDRDGAKVLTLSMSSHRGFPSRGPLQLVRSRSIPKWAALTHVHF